jgi:carbonic anhydrase
VKNLHWIVLLVACFSITCRAEVATAPALTKTAAELRAESDKAWATMVEGNKRFISGKTQTRELLEKRKELAKGQSPKVIVLACADSRVSPELLFDQNLGDLFVVRTAGNIGGKIVIGSIEYAAEHLGSSVLLVLGHENCGAVAAAASGDVMPSDNLKKIVDDIKPAVDQAAATGATKDALIAKAVECNVSVSAENLLKNSKILSHLVETGKLQVVQAVYSLETGEVKVLDAKAPKEAQHK